LIVVDRPGWTSPIDASFSEDLLDRGRQEGEAQGEATTARIQALPLEQLELLAEALLDFSGPTDLAAWLEEHKG